LCSPKIFEVVDTRLKFWHITERVLQQKNNMENPMRRTNSRKKSKHRIGPPKPLDPDALLVSIPQAARMLGVSQSLLFGKLADGTVKLPIRRIPGTARSLIARADLEEYARTLPVRESGSSS
jgi:hypothetical protein